MATLRALGFSSLAVAAGVLLEALLLALVGAGAGAAFAYALFNGATISTLGGAVWDSQLVYSLAISPALVLQVVLLACALGLAGGLLPAIRAARANIADVLHERTGIAWSYPDGRCSEERPPKLKGVLCGAFNPLHDGHRQLRTVAARRLGELVGYELSLHNVDKPPS